MAELTKQLEELPLQLQKQTEELILKTKEHEKVSIEVEQIRLDKEHKIKVLTQGINFFRQRLVRPLHHAIVSCPRSSARSAHCRVRGSVRDIYLIDSHFILADTL